MNINEIEREFNALMSIRFGAPYATRVHALGFASTSMEADQFALSGLNVARLGPKVFVVGADYYLTRDLDPQEKDQIFAHMAGPDFTLPRIASLRYRASRPKRRGLRPL